jgi:8-amino-7-oxononanoate synthase
MIPEQKASTPLPFADDILKELDDLREQDLFRTTRQLPSGCVSFASNDYLNLSQNPELIAAADKALQKYGTGSGSSRLIAGSSQLIDELETEIARFKKCPASLVFPSGYQTAISVIPALIGPGDQVILDKLNHASLIDGARLSRARIRTYRHADPRSLQKILKKKLSGRRLVITDSLFSMDGDVPPLRELGQLCADYDAAFMVDEAHATGCLGESGRGAAEHCGAENLVHISMGTISKAMGGMGGFIAGSKILIELLINKARGFIYTTAPAPAQLGAALAALKIFSSQKALRRELADKSAFLREKLKARNFDIGSSCSHIIPVILGPNSVALQAREALLAKGYYCPVARYPTVPADKARLRLSLSTAHTQEEITGLVEALISWRDSRD